MRTILPASEQARRLRHISTSDPGLTTASAGPSPNRKPLRNRRVADGVVRTCRDPTIFSRSEISCALLIQLPNERRPTHRVTANSELINIDQLGARPPRLRSTLTGQLAQIATIERLPLARTGEPPQRPYRVIPL